MVTNRGIKSRAQPAAKGDSPSPVLRAQGLRTRNLLLDTAGKLLLAEGPLGFTMRRVADEAGVTISNLQYYFPGRAELLRAVMAPVLEGYTAEMASAVDAAIAPEVAQAVLEALFNRVLEDARRQDNSALILHFWSIGVADKEAEQVLSEAYEILISGVAKLICCAYPTIAAADGQELAAVLIGMCDGLLVQLGLAHRKQASVDDIVARFRTSGRLLLEQATAAKAAAAR